MGADTQATSVSLNPSGEHAPLQGVRVCLVFEHSLTHYTRILQEIAGLQQAGAEVQLLTSFPEDEEPPDGVRRTVAPLELPSRIAASQVRWRPLRIADNLMRHAIRRITGVLRRADAAQCRTAALEKIALEADMFWVVDFPSLPTAHTVARRTGRRVVYETVDLVPEYRYRGERFRRKTIKAERKLIGDVDGFITACDSYADYYMERYGGSVLSRRPVVRDNMPGHVVAEIGDTHRPLRLLFLGSLMFDRPILELIEAMRVATPNATLTFQGKNYLGDAPARRIAELGLQDRVAILEPCPPDEIVSTASAYDVGIVALRGLDENERRASTSKLFTYMAAGLAIVGSDLPGISTVLSRSENGILVDDMTPRLWARAFERISKMPEADVSAMRQKSLAVARSVSWDVQESDFVAEFLRALGRDEQDLRPSQASAHADG